MSLPYESNIYSQSQLRAYGWRAFCVEFLCGIVAIAWYLLALAETITLRGLTRLEKAADPHHENANNNRLSRSQDSG